QSFTFSENLFNNPKDHGSTRCPIETRVSFVGRGGSHWVPYIVNTEMGHDINA
ncbi:hypothetical protein J6590_097366, partial [Homalodisca vitripennis]